MCRFYKDKDTHINIFRNANFTNNIATINIKRLFLLFSYIFINLKNEKREMPLDWSYSGDISHKTLHSSWGNVHVYFAHK